MVRPGHVYEPSGWEEGSRMTGGGGCAFDVCCHESQREGRQGGSLGHRNQVVWSISWFWLPPGGRGLE